MKKQIINKIFDVDIEISDYSDSLLSIEGAREYELEVIEEENFELFKIELK